MAERESSLRSALTMLAVCALAAVAGLMILRVHKHFSAVKASNAAVQLIENERYAEALETLERAEFLARDEELLATIHANQAIALAGHGQELYTQGAYAEAVRALEGVEPRSPKVAKESRAWYLVGLSLLELPPSEQTFRRAETAFEQAVADRPEDDEARYELERVRLRLRALPLAEEAFEAYRLRDLERAERLFGELADDAELLSVSGEAFPHLHLAWIALARAREAEMVEQYRAADERAGAEEAESGLDAEQRLRLETRLADLRREIVRLFPDRAEDLEAAGLDTLFD